MSELKQVVWLAASQRKTDDDNAAKLAAIVEEERRQKQAALEKLLNDLATMRCEVGPRLGMYVSPIGNPRVLQGISVAISSTPTWVRRPFVQYKITLSPIDGRKLRIEETISPSSHRSERNYSNLLSGKQILDVLRLDAAEFLNAGAQFRFAPPRWYFVMGNLIGWPLAASTWLLCIVFFSWSGFLFGWIPAAMVFGIALSCWPLVIGGLIWTFHQAMS